MARTLYIIDGHGHIYAAYYAPMRQQLTSPTGEPTKAVYIFTTMLLGLIDRCRPDMLAIAMDSKTPTFRSEIYPPYKAHRPPMPEDMPSQIDRIEQILQAMHIPILRVEGFEADDVIGTLAKRASRDGIECLICSKDKDVLQLLDEHISTFDLKTGTRMDIETMRRTMGITPQQFIDCLALQGDPSDNIPGIPDVGPKTALNWIRKFGSIENLYANIDQIKGKRAENLRRFQDNLAVSRKLVTINCDIPLEVTYDQLALKEPDRDQLARIFAELGFERLSKQLQLNSGSASAGRGSAAVAKISPVGRPDSADSVDHCYELIDTADKLEHFVDQLRQQPIFSLDTETTSLSAMTAELVGISFCWKPHQAFYLPLKAPLGARCLDLRQLREKLCPILADPQIKKVGQNIKFDLIVLRNAQMPVDGVHFDTMVASYCLDPGRPSHSLDAMARDFLNYRCIHISELIGKGKNQLTFDLVDPAAACRYAAEDADITFQLYQYLSKRLQAEPTLWNLFERVEMPLVSVLAEMEYTGVFVDTASLSALGSEIERSLRQITEKIYDYAGTVFNIDSPKQLAEVLFDRLGLKPVRLGKVGRSTDAGVLEQLADEHPIIEWIIRYRTLSKLKNTYIDKLPALVNLRTGRVHASFNQTVTATGRLSSSDPNLQNIPIRTDLGRKIRAAFVAQDPQNCILSADYSQIELRLLAHFSKDPALCHAFAADQDIHAFVASQVYGVPLDQVTSEMRSRSKAVNFGIIYGQGAYGLSRTIGISPAEAKKFIDRYFERYSAIRAFINQCIEKARETGYAETILGRRRRILNLRSKNANKKAQAERLAVNTVIQGSAADLIKVAMINIHRKIQAEHLPVRLILQVHDELVFELPADQAEQHADWIRHEMINAIGLDVPLKVDISYGPSWLAEK